MIMGAASLSFAVEPNGMIIYHDGSHPTEYDPPIEYTKFTSYGATFKLQLPNGQTFPGITRLLVFDVDYTNPSEDQISFMESLAAKYIAVAPILKRRIAEMKAVLFSKQGNIHTAKRTKEDNTAGSIQYIMLAGVVYKRVLPRKTESGALKFTHEDGEGSVRLSDLTLKTLKLLGSTNTDLPLDSAYRAAVSRFVPEMTINSVPYSGLRIWRKEGTDTILLTDSGLVRCSQKDLDSDQWAKLSANDDGSTLQYQTLTNESFPKPRFNAEQIGALVAASTIHQRAGVADEFGLADDFGVADQKNLIRKQKSALVEYLNSHDENIQNLVTMELGSIYANEVIEQASNQTASAVHNFEKLCKERFGPVGILFNAAENEGRLRDIFTSSIRDTADMYTPVQAAQINTRNIMLLKSNLQKKARDYAAAIAEQRDEGKESKGEIMKLRIKAHQGILWLQVINITGRVWHHCLLTAHRNQKAIEPTGSKPLEKVGEIGLMKLLGFSDKAILMNAINALSHVSLVKTEYGSMIFVQELGPGDSLTFPLAPHHDLKFTRTIEASLWCDEGKALDQQADLTPVTE